MDRDKDTSNKQSTGDYRIYWMTVSVVAVLISYICYGSAYLLWVYVSPFSCVAVIAVIAIALLIALSQK